MTKRATPYRAIYVGGRLAVNIPQLGYGQTGMVYPQRQRSIARKGRVTTLFFVPDGDLWQQIHHVRSDELHVP